MCVGGVGEGRASYENAFYPWHRAALGRSGGTPSPPSPAPHPSPWHATLTPSWWQNSCRALLWFSGKLAIWRLNAGDLRSLSWGEDLV